MFERQEQMYSLQNHNYSHQYQTDPSTTVTHTTITYSDGDTNDGAALPAAKDSSQAEHDSKPERLVVPNASVPVLSPLFLRCNPLQRAVFARVSRTHSLTPVERVEDWKAEKGYSAQYRLAPTAEVPVQCTFTMHAFLAQFAAVQHIINTPVLNVSAFCL
ncbi:unnamed protein product, partial [Strongylus vulgaris]